MYNPHRPKTTKEVVLELVNDYYNGEYVLTPECFIQFNAGLTYTEYILLFSSLEYYFDIELSIDKFDYTKATVGDVIKYVEELILEQEW